MYTTLWEKFYGVNLPKENEGFLESIVDYVNGKNFV